MRLISVSNYLFEALTRRGSHVRSVKDCIRHRAERGELHIKVQVTFVQQKKKRREM